MLKEKVTSFIIHNRLISKGDHIAVALSAGRDSVCLLFILNQLTSQLNFKLSAIHVNHGIRGQAADKDQRFAEKICHSLSIKCASFRLSGFTKNTSEEALRKARYTVFDDFLQSNDNTKIATGHHLNDQLETYLMRLFKGSGAKGLLGIPLVRDKYIRPLLEISRKEINTFCNENKIVYMEDHSNSSYDKLRNKVRLKLIPHIENVFGDNYLEYFLKSHLKYKGLYNDYYKSNIDHFIKISKTTKDQTEVLIHDIELMSDLQKTQYLEYCFSSVYGLHYLTGAEKISEFKTFIKSAGTGTKFVSFNSIVVLKDRDKLIFYPAAQQSEKRKKLYLNKSIKFGNCKLLLKQVVNRYHFGDNKLVENICADNVHLPLTVRAWQYGDYFYPLGSNKRQKLSDFFINNKVSRINKKRIPIICSDKHIVWIAGFRIDNRYRVTDNCDKVFRLEMIYE